MQHVIFPPAGLDKPIIGSQADCLDPTSEMLAAYSHKYALTKDPNDQKIANLFGIDTHTVARGRQELFSGDVQMHRVRKKGAGRKPVEKKSLGSLKK